MTLTYLPYGMAFGGATALYLLTATVGESPLFVEVIVGGFGSLVGFGLWLYSPLPNGNVPGDGRYWGFTPPDDGGEQT